MVAFLLNLPAPILLLLVLLVSIMLILLLLMVALHPDAGKRVSNVIIAVGSLRDRRCPHCNQYTHSKRGVRREQR